MRAAIICLLSFLTTLTVAAYAADEPSTKFTLSTNAFLDTGPVPVLYTCDGKDLSPKLDWTNVPTKAKSFALIVSDADAPSGTFYHWILYNIPTSANTLNEGVSSLPVGTLVGKNDFKKMQYNGPCPPKGAAHTYTFTLYALDNKLDLPTGSDGLAVMKAISKHAVDQTSLTMVYSRWLK